MRFTDKRGAIAITIMPIMTALLLLTATFVGMGHIAFLVLSAVWSAAVWSPAGWSPAGTMSVTTSNGATFRCRSVTGRMMPPPLSENFNSKPGV